MLENRIARIKTLIAKREEIDAELSQLMGLEPRTGRGRRSKAAEAQSGEPALEPSEA